MSSGRVSTSIFDFDTLYIHYSAFKEVHSIFAAADESELGELPALFAPLITSPLSLSRFSTTHPPTTEGFPRDGFPRLFFLNSVTQIN